MSSPLRFLRDFCGLAPAESSTSSSSSYSEGADLADPDGLGMLAGYAPHGPKGP